MRKRRKLIFWLVFSLALIGGGFWFNEYRTAGIRDVINPMYWVRRWRGDDLYDPSTRVLFHGNRSLKEIALTIDDGPHEPTGAQLLDVLKQYNVRATFFVVGRRLSDQPDLVRRMLQEGHEVANHSENHYRLDTLP